MFVAALEFILFIPISVLSALVLWFYFAVKEAISFLYPNIAFCSHHGDHSSFYLSFIICVSLFVFFGFLCLGLILVRLYTGKPVCMYIYN